MPDLFDALHKFSYARGLVDPRDDEPVPRCVAVTEGSELVVPHNDPRLIDIEWLSGAVDRVGARKFQRDGRPIGPSHESVFAPMILAAENPNNKTTLVNCADGHLPRFVQRRKRPVGVPQVPVGVEVSVGIVTRHLSRVVHMRRRRCRTGREAKGRVGAAGRADERMRHFR